jgi:hypothetical protein
MSHGIISKNPEQGASRIIPTGILCGPGKPDVAKHTVNEAMRGCDAAGERQK